jgi:serine/threonine protein kinase
MRSPTLRRDVPRTVGRYELADLLGEGASGEVWRATDPSIGRPVAVKLFRVPEGFGAAQRAEWEQRFLLEARAAGQLSHPGIVSVHDVGTTPEGRPFIVMELVEGRSLEAIRRADAPVPMDRLIDWMAQVADALDAAHRRGIVHRDVKPANILVDADGRARIADFGVARLPDSEMTREGAFLGSPDVPTSSRSVPCSTGWRPGAAPSTVPTSRPWPTPSATPTRRRPGA